MVGISKAQEVEIEGTRTAPKRFNPLEMLELRKAVLDRKPTIRLRDKTFTLRYADSSLFYRPVKGFAPCGWLNIKRVENYTKDID